MCVANLAVQWFVLSLTQDEYPPNHSVITPKSLRNHPLLDAIYMLNSIRFVRGDSAGMRYSICFGGRGTIRRNGHREKKVPHSTAREGESDVQMIFGRNGQS